ncbi:LAQU0S05e03290g1_1 [Lachancea quebecensis]|uniref:LAQU0S05e03290g1_1 n=1 Tax=Lachancea quebecensis TaxID=1654605 RepID=A0A0P1KTK6_9SACH|nr:LAQU0S05e03290g1_1 [Lachancea quebecensis]
MRIAVFFAALISHICLAIANTESIVFKVPDTFLPVPLLIAGDNQASISLRGTNRALKTFDVPVDSQFEVELVDLSPGDTFFAKLCWTAIDPIDITSLSYSVRPDYTARDGHWQDAPLRFFLTFKAEPNSYPHLSKPSVPINISVSAIRMGIPVDLHATIIFMTLLIGVIFIANRHHKLYDRFKNA